MATLNTATSIVDLLKSQGKASDFNSRKSMYESTYGGVYSGSTSQNTQMIRGVTNTSPVMSTNTTRVNDVQNSVRADQLATSLGASNPNQINQTNVDATMKGNQNTNVNANPVNNTQVDPNNPNTTSTTQTNDASKRREEFIAQNPFAKDILDSIDKADKDTATITTQLQDLRTRFDDNNKMLLDQITKKFQARRLELEDANMRILSLKKDQGYDTGMARYTADQYTGGILNEERDAVQRMAELDAEELSLVVQAQNAKNDKDFELLGKMLDAAESTRKQKQDTLNTLYKNMVEYEKNKDTNTIEQQQKVYNFAQDQVTTAAPEILKQMAGLDDTQKEAFLTGLAKQYKIDVNSLKGMLETARYDVAKDEKAIAPKATTTKTGTSTGSSTTKSSTTSTSSANFSPEIMSWANKIQAGSADIASVPSALRGQVNLAVDELNNKKDESFTGYFDKSISMLSADKSGEKVYFDDGGYLTKEAFDLIVSGAKELGIQRSEVLKKIKQFLYTNKYKYVKNYGITQSEFDKYLQ